MKRFAALLAVGVLTIVGCACTLSGCGSSGDNSSADKDGNGYADEIYLYNWSEYMTQDVLDQFQKEYGIKVIQTTYESDDELLAKLIAGKKGEYDIAVPTNTYIQAFKDNDLLEPLDKSALTNLKNIDPAYLNLDYDQGNQYTVPYMGTLSVMLANKKMLNQLGVTVNNTQDLLNPALKNNVLIFDDVEGDITLGLQGAGLDPNTKNVSDLSNAEKYLMKLNSNIKSFSQISDERISAARGEVALSYIYSGDALQAMADNPDLEIVMKKEKFPLTLDNMVILKGTKHKKEAELFLNFILRPDISAELTKAYQYVCFNKAAVSYLPKSLQDAQICVLSDDIKNNLVIVKEKSGDMLDKMVTVMTEVKSAK